ncbi:hypothetical protein [Nocardia amikacinitolerans]|uniref:hypothetical protein n=1 Tax=Nocardia amikacinitolerans TaxID=756689 RepID=UPI0020A53DA5|nr:hypothetical protein [Nocardia amikacinitolerans]
MIYQLKELSGERQERNERDMAILGREWGYDIARRLAMPRTWSAPIFSLLHMIDKVDASAVIVPELGHLNGNERAITEKCALIDASERETYKKGHRWPAWRPRERF